MYKKNIQEFADAHNLVFQEDGEVGFARKCVGLTKNGHYVGYNPVVFPDYDYIKELFDKRFYDIMPPDAYHKSDCLCVLGQSEESLKQLSEWIDRLKALDVTIESYSTGAVGVQAIFSGEKNYALKIK